MATTSAPVITELTGVKIAIKYSITEGNVPTVLDYGEFAVNLADEKLFIGSPAGVKTLFDAKKEYDLATSTKSGLLAAADKTKLDKLLAAISGGKF